MAKHAPLFHAAAERAGIALVADRQLHWLTRHGHLAPAVAEALSVETRRALDEILVALGGDAAVLAAKPRGGMSADFVYTPTNQVVEYDEVQHFTTARLTTLRLYPDGVPIGFEPSRYAAIVERWRARGDQGFAYKEAAEFPGPRGRQRQRAYFDRVP